jgi:hypothetical protein
MVGLGDHLLLFGGRSQANVYLNDTWTFDGGTWAQRNVAGPPARSFFGMTATP